MREKKKKQETLNKSECYKAMLNNPFFTILENLKEMDEFLDSSKSTHLNPQEINNLNRLIINEVINSNKTFSI